jgi:sortase (surface protein transpeptidase)
MRIRIPAIGVDASVQSLTVDQNGVLPPPDSYDVTGWWREGPETGERAPAVIAGQVDSKRGPAVFFRLTDLGTGDQIFVDRADGTTAEFATQRIERHDKNAFPTDAVYRDTPDSQLRLITCGGKFDRKAHRYIDNIIVFAIRAG